MATIYDDAISNVSLTSDVQFCMVTFLSHKEEVYTPVRYTWSGFEQNEDRLRNCKLLSFQWEFTGRVTKSPDTGGFVCLRRRLPIDLTALTVNARISARGAYLIFGGERGALIRRGALISFSDF